MTTRVELSAALVESFSGMFLSPMYDNAVPTPNFHREGWDLYCAPIRLASLVAPRGHAKSTGFTHDFGLAALLFRARSYAVIVSATEDLAKDHLGDMAKVFRENDEVRGEFGIAAMEVDAKTEIVVRFNDGHRCRVVAKGSGQKMRGMKWMGKRPDLILGDDLEDDDQVANAASRKAFRKWFNRTLLPCLSRTGIARVHGTIIHQDSLLARLQKNSQWATLFFKAHRSINDFSKILWPEQFSEKDLREIKQRFMEDGDAAGYSQEYLNTPLDDGTSFLNSEGFLPMQREDFMAPKIVRIGCDFAVSTADSANKTSFTVGGQTPDNLICVFDQRSDRWNTEEWIDEMFSLQVEHDPLEWVVEGGVIWNAVWPTIRKEMRIRDTWLNFRVINPVKDKAARAIALKRRHRAGAMRYSKDASWYEEYEEVMKLFTAEAEAAQDDEFDSTAIMVKGFEMEAPVDDEDYKSDEEWEEEQSDPLLYAGRDEITGY